METAGASRWPYEESEEDAHKICSATEQELRVAKAKFQNHGKSGFKLDGSTCKASLRLQEARRLLLGENLDAASAGYRVGYDDASQFNREYKRLFGAPPARDVERLREAAAMESAPL